MTKYNGLNYIPDRAVKGRSWARVIIIGGGQAGLAMGHFLKKANVDFLILDAGKRIGDPWRKRWDSLRLFSSALHDGLPGMPFPGDPRSFPTKEQVADYLEEYAVAQQLPVRFNTRVQSLHRHGERFRIRANGREYFEAEQVVVATGPYQKLQTPSWAADLDPAIVQIHASEYKNPSQMPKGDVLVVGAGNTGAELSLELAAAGHNVWLSGRDIGEVPRFARYANGRVFWFLATRLFTLSTPIGRQIRASLRAGHGGPLVRIRKKDLLAAGIKRVGRTTGSRHGKPRLADGTVLDVASVLWCNGFRLDFSWIHLPVLADDGYPVHEFGRIRSQPGLYFLALPFQRDLTSTLLGGVGRDAALVARWILERMSESSLGPQLESSDVETRLTGT